MPSTPSTRLRLEKQELGENLNTWGQTKLNDVIERLDEAVAGVEAVAISGAATVLTSVNYSTDQSRKASLVLTGTLTANSTVTVPGVQKLYLVVDNTTRAGFTLTLKTAAGTGYALRGGPQWVYCNGTDIFRATPRLDQLPAPTAVVDMAGQKITTLGAPTVGTDATTKTYVDAGDAATVTAVSGIASAAAGSASAASGSATAAAGSATAAAGSATAAANSATAAAGSASAASTSASNAAGSATAAQNAAASISGGPVTSVNGQTGIVSLSAVDVGAASSGHTHAYSSLTGLPTLGTAAAQNTTAFATAAQGTLATNALPAAGGTAVNTTLTGYRLTHNARGNVSGAQTIDLSLGNYVSATAAGAVTWTVANVPAAPAAAGFVLELTNGGAAVQTWPASFKWPGGTAPTLTAAGVDLLVALTDDGGTTWRACLSQKGSA